MFKKILCIACISLFFSATSHAADERFTVEIKVDVSDANASLAREKAMNSATRAAVAAVAKRISTSQGAKKIADMTDAQLINFIKETSVVNERNSDVRYMADLKIIINEELLKQYMSEREIPIVTQHGKSVLIIPVFREFSEDAPMLWETDNLWKQAWDTTSISSAIKFITIPNTANYQSVIDANKAASTDYSSLESAASLSGANDVFVLDASYNGIEGLTIVATSLSGEKFEINVAGTKSSGAELFNQAVIETLAKILYPFASLGQWITAERKIKNLAEVTSMQIQAMSPGKSQFKLTYTGDNDNLLRLLRAQGYNLEDNGNYMILKDIGE